MEHYVDPSRAAHLAGVTVDSIQQLVNRGAIALHEGRLAITELCAFYPEIDLTGAKMVDVTDQIKDDAIAKALRLKSGSRTVGDVLAENRHLKRDVAHYREQAGHYRALCDDLRRMLDAIPAHAGETDHVHNVVRWLDQKLRAMK